MAHIDETREHLRSSPRAWLVTGAAGFIGSHLVEHLLELGQDVVGLDNFATGRRINLEQVEQIVGADAWKRFRFIEGDIRDLETCGRAVEGAQHILHQAALGSVPRSLEDPLTSNAVNVGGQLNMLWAAHRAGIESFVYAASSSTYGDHEALPKVEDRIGNPLSPYAVTKLVNEQYADVFRRQYGLAAIGLRYFNVFGPRQDPDGAYAAVIPKWIQAALDGRTIRINGDGSTSRDFCYVANVVQANILAAVAPNEGRGEVYNVALGDRTSLLELNEAIRTRVTEVGHEVPAPAEHGPFRKGDVLHSQASVEKAERLLGYEPRVRFADGLATTVDWFAAQHATA